MIKPSSNIYVAQSSISKAGRGVFAAENIQKDEIIEVVPVLFLPLDDYKIAKKTRLKNYYFMWENEDQGAALALGFGSLYNHSYKPNATYKKIVNKDQINFISLKDIVEDEEITVNYNYGNPDDKTALWIDDIPH